MSTCKLCKHWGKSKRGEYRLCKLAGSTDGYPDGSLQGLDGKPVSDRKAMAFALDSSHYGASLLTDPDFGCNQFEKK